MVELAEVIKGRSAEKGIFLTFFEFVTVMALVYFARRKVDVAVVEVGLGGRWDATNLVVPRASIITTISKDHEIYLGSDLLSIAREKGGIIKKGVPVICGSLSPDVEALFREMAKAKGSASYFLGRDFSYALKEDGHFDYAGIGRNLTDLSLALRGRYQRGNAALALAALEVAAGDFPVSEAAVRSGLEAVFWPGRFEVVWRRPTVILDGAHNGEGIDALVSEIRDFQEAKKVKLLFAAMGDKDWPLMLGKLLAVASEVVLTRVPMERSADPKKIERTVDEGVPLTVIEDPVQGLRFLLDRAGPDDVVLVAGSLYLLGQVRPWILKRMKAETFGGDLAHVGT